MSQNKRLAKNAKIKESCGETRRRHAKMLCKAFTTKIDESSLTKGQKEDLDRCLLEAKWFRNHVIDWSRKEGNEIWNFDYKTVKITHKDKDFNDVPVEIRQLTGRCRQSIISQLVSNCKTLATLKKKGYQNPGQLKFKPYAIVPYA